MAADVAAGISGSSPAAVYVTNCSAAAVIGTGARQLQAAGTQIVYTVAAVTSSAGSAQALWNALAALTTANFATTASSVQGAAGVPGAYVATPQTSAITAACGGGGSATCGTLPTGPTSPSQGGASTNVGAIVGGVIGGVAALAIVVAIVVLVRRRRNQQRTSIIQPTPTKRSTPAVSAPGWRHDEIERRSSLRYESSELVDAEPIFVASHTALAATSRAPPRVYGTAAGVVSMR